MNDELQHKRTMNLNAHFAWGFALWAAADTSRLSGNLMLAPIGYYYACFHTSYAYLNAVPGVEPSTFDRMGHQQLSNLIAQHLSDKLQLDFDEMRDLRETINYLGLGDPAGKLRVVRGHPLRFGARSKSESFDDVVTRVRNSSLSFVRETLDAVERLAKQAVDRYPKRGDPTEAWLEEYMQEDIYLGLMSDEMRGKTLRILHEILK